MNKLLRIIRDHTFWSIGCVVQRQSFDSILSKEAKQVCGGAYGLAALACWRHLGLILQKMDAWMDCFMEAGARGRHAIQAIVDEDSKIPHWQEEHRIRSLSFEDKRVPQSQAADILAYELYKQSSRQLEEGEISECYPLTQLNNNKRRWVYYGEGLLKEFDEDISRQLTRFSK